MKMGSLNKAKVLGLATLVCLVVGLSACSLSCSRPVHTVAPSLQDLSTLTNEWTDVKSGKRIHIEVTFDAQFPDVVPQGKTLTSGAVPFRVTATVTEIRTVRGENVERQITGDKAQVLVYHQDGKVVLNETVPLITLCGS